MSAAQIGARVAGRKAAREIFELLQWPDGFGADFADGFVDEIRDMLPKRRIEPVPPEKSLPIARLGATRIPFGQYKDQTFDEAPLDYLDWLCRSQEEFYKDLRAYLKHPEVESRRHE